MRASIRLDENNAVRLSIFWLSCFCCTSSKPLDRAKLPSNNRLLLAKNMAQKVWVPIDQLAQSIRSWPRLETIFKGSLGKECLTTLDGVTHTVVGTVVGWEEAVFA